MKRIRKNPVSALDKNIVFDLGSIEEGYHIYETYMGASGRTDAFGRKLIITFEDHNEAPAVAKIYEYVDENGEPEYTVIFSHMFSQFRETFASGLENEEFVFSELDHARIFAALFLIDLDSRFMQSVESIGESEEFSGD